jgi:NADPH2:quinone reductase
MRAVLSETYGALPEVRDIPEPSPDAGEVKIRVRASSLNGFDAKVAAGFLKGAMEHQFPVVLGRDFAGTITEVGSGVSQFMPGEEVFGVVAKPMLGDGSFAEYVSVPQEIGLAPLPAGLDYREAGVLGLAGCTAIDALDAVRLEHAETILICGATGGVGSYAVQLAAAREATVIATATPGEAARQMHLLGAAHTVDYRGDIIGQVRSLAPAGVDAVLHLAGDPAALVTLLAPGGRMASTLNADPALAEGATSPSSTSPRSRIGQCSTGWPPRPSPVAWSPRSPTPITWTRFRRRSPTSTAPARWANSR